MNMDYNQILVTCISFMEDRGVVIDLLLLKYLPGKLIECCNNTVLLCIVIRRDWGVSGSAGSYVLVV